MSWHSSGERGAATFLPGGGFAGKRHSRPYLRAGARDAVPLRTPDQCIQTLERALWRGGPCLKPVSVEEVFGQCP